MSVKITALQAENVKRIKAVEITPAATGLTILGGNNNQGKTSILDAIAWALGGEKYRPTAPHREGAISAPYLKVNLSNGIVVERKGKNSALTVTDPSGKRGGQQLLNEFVEQLALDLPRFMNAGDREKADTLLKIIGIGDKLGSLDRQIKALYDQRTVKGQIAAQKKAYAEEMQEYPEAPDQPVSAVELIRQQQEILARNGENQRKRTRLSLLESRDGELKARVDHLEAQLADARLAYDTNLADLKIARMSAQDLKDESTREIEQSLQEIEEINRKVRANMDKEQALEDARELEAQYRDMTQQLKDLRADRQALLEGADLPLPDLGVEDGCLTYKGRHWTDMSGSDQLRVATAIVRKLNPACGFVLLDKLEQMDLHTMQEFGSWLEGEGLQAIATRVSTGDECQIIIEDGTVLDQKVQPAPRKEFDFRKGVF